MFAQRFPMLFLVATVAISGCKGTEVLEASVPTSELTSAQKQSEKADIVYANTVGITTDIWIMNSVDKSIFNVTNDVADDFSPSWSKDFFYIIFSSARDGNREIYSIRRDGTKAHRLTDNPAPDYSPVWSPDNSRIAFVREVTPGHQQIFVMDGDGSNPVNISKSNFNDIQPSWSPDGTKIVFSSDRDAKHGSGVYNEVYTMNVNGTGVTRLTFNDDGIDYYPSWSPDGTKIAFATHRATNKQCYAFALEIWVMNVDGSAPHAFGDNCYGDAGPSWSPDGGSMLIMSDRASSTPYKWDVWIVGSSSSQSPVRITTSGDVSQARWGRPVEWQW